MSALVNLTKPSIPGGPLVHVPLIGSEYRVTRSDCQYWTRRTEGLRADLVTCNALVDVCSQAREWQATLSGLDYVRLRLVPFAWFGERFKVVYRMAGLVLRVVVR